MSVIKCSCCNGFIAPSVPAFGVQDDGAGGRFALVNCPGCRSTVGRPMPDLYVTVRGIVAVGKKGPAFGSPKAFTVRALVAA